MQDWNDLQHQWPSVELLSALGHDTTAERKSALVRAVWNSVANFAPASHWVEGGYVPLADSRGNLQEFFAHQIYPAVGLPREGEASHAFGRLVLRDLTDTLASTGQPYGPHGAYLMLGTHGELICQADLPGYSRRSFYQQLHSARVA